MSKKVKSYFQTWGNTVLLLSLLWGLFSLIPSDVLARQAKPVLVLCSYHQGDQWTDRIVQGIRSVFNEEKVMIYYEYLDARRHREADWMRIFGSIIGHKYREVPLELIICADDPALDFALQQRSRLFPDVPIVFCGINDFQPRRIGGHQNVTGVNEALDIGETIKIGLQLHPGAKHLVAVISDTQPHWRATAAAFQRVSSQFADRVKIREIKNLTIADAPSVLKTISADSIVLSLADLLENGHKDTDRRTSWRFLSEHSVAPVYTLWEPALGTGVVGGKVVSGFSQGEAAARLADRILSGESASNIPVVIKSPNVSMFDWRAMQRFGIREKDLPPGSQIFSKPFSFYEQYRMWIWIGLAVFLIQSWLLVVLLINRARRLKGEKSLRESEERYKELYEDAPVAYHEYDQEGRIVRVNKKELEMLGYTPEELIGKYVWDFVIEKEEAEKSIKGRIAGYVPPAKGLERTYRRKDGKTVPVLIDEATLKEEAGRIIGVRSAIQDITELKRAEEKIIASLKEKEVLLKEIHHRVRNNLTTIVSILSLQAPYLEDRKSQEIFRECENRVRTMSKIHTKLYQSKDLAHIDFGSYLRELSSELFMSYQVNPEAIDLEIDVDDIELDINAALPLGLLLTELITNSLKYAFPGGRKGRLQVNLQKVVDRMVLSVADDGIGFPEHLDYQNTTSLGLQLVMGLVRQLDGTIDMKREQGTAFNITFPEAK